jgi:hypothetical protein
MVSSLCVVSCISDALTFSRLVVASVSDSGKNGIIYAGMGLPTFHAAGIILHVYIPLSTGYPTALFPHKDPAPPIVPSPANILEAAKATKANAIAAVPAFIEVSAQNAYHRKILMACRYGPNQTRLSTISRLSG